MHEVFLCRLANHPVFRNDHNFQVFLNYDGEVWPAINNLIFSQDGKMKQKVIIIMMMMVLSFVFLETVERARKEQERNVRRTN